MKTWQIFAGAQHLQKCVWLCALFFSILPFTGKSQDITIENPSLEGTPAGGAVPPSWIKSTDSPDIQPGFFGVARPASDGKTYVGILANKNWTEGIAQQLKGVLKAGRTYQLSFDLAYTTFYYRNICSGALEIYGGNTASERKERLWFSGFIRDTAWQTMTVTFTPSADYTYLSFWTCFDSTCTKNRLSGLLLDHFSGKIREVPQIKVSVHNSCKGLNNGTLSVSVSNGNGPYTYRCMPGNYRGNTVSNLGAGTYEVTVTGANGISAKQKVQVTDYEMTVDASITNARCAGGNDGQLVLKARGGIEPYKFSMDSGNTFQDVPVFSNIGPGSYNVLVKDRLGCITAMDDFVITQPAPLSVVSAKTRVVSCSSVKDGQIILTVTGGTSPYRYGLSKYNTQADSILHGLDAGEYHYYVLDSHDCSIDGSVVIERHEGNCGVFIPTAFSPNGDGKNDLFKVVVRNAVKDFNLTVYGRWGELIFRTTHTDQGWDGYYRGNELPAGTYVYMVTYIDSMGQTMKQTGSLVLVR